MSKTIHHKVIVKSKGLDTFDDTTKTEKRQKSRKTMTPADIISFNNTEIEQLFNDIKIGREHANEGIKLIPSLTRFSDTLNEHHQHTEIIKNLMQNLTNKKGDHREEFTSCMTATGITTSLISYEMSDRNEKLIEIMQKWKLFLENTKDYIKNRIEYDKLFKEYNKIIEKVKQMNSQTKPDVKKAAQLQEQKEEITIKTIKEGDQLRKLYNEMYVTFMNLMMGSCSKYHNFIKKSPDTYINYQNQFNQGIEKFNTVIDESSDDDETIKPPDWMNNSPNCFHMFQAESMYLESMNYLIQIYAKKILFDPNLALSGFSIDDVNLIFSGIELIRRLHSGILRKLSRCTLETFLSVYSSRVAQIYQVYHNHCSKFGKAFSRFHQCLNSHQFKNFVEEIATSNKIPPLGELLRTPFIQLSQYVPIFTRMKSEFTNNIEDLETLIYVFTRLSGHCELAETNFATAMEMNKISGVPPKQPPYRRFFSSIPCSLNKTEGVMFLFSDTLMFTKSNKEHEQVFVEQYETKNIEKFEINEKQKTVKIIFATRGKKLRDLDLFFNKLDIAHKFTNELSQIGYFYKNKKIFGVDIKLATQLHEDETRLMPKVLHHIFDALELTAPSTEGIMRLSSNVIELDGLIYKIDAGGDIDDNRGDTLLLANTIKKYCAGLPNKLPLKLQITEGVSNIQSILQTLDKSYLAFIERLFRV
ncbi:hypothetical protein EDI_044700 [Entamoeba dispar SAW760]|uniref:DH domain-containing protein n=1 Tax=Entamoeba dispar (strain ATCC PRA-260 / SAW760) TaxID=370354 RepID=B0EHX0_ENTDS|nr:uncharacterized protein EDI_044700 [Entamoeba dispar SAW760]EDR25914.1 hypothetical protein EDI_044700 [Entamoeba dispar SAW760]|eukprot:EDR25914.1 hypothetical protein EDI_044700 [Entamoeba dispar SAW760]